MSVTFEELIGSVRTTGVGQSKREVDSVRDSFRTLGDAIEALGTLGGLTFLFSQLQELGRTLADVTGVGIAARFQGIARALTAVTGSAEKANRILEQLKRLGKETAFDTADVSEVAARMLGAGVSEQRVIPELQALLDLASHGAGLSRQDFPEFMRNLLQIRGRGTGHADLADINQLKDRVPQIGAFLAAGLGGKVTREDALKKAQGMTGKELYDTIIKGSQVMAQGAAAAKALYDPIAALGNTMETLQMAMEPTGAILLFFLRPLISFGQRLADLLQWVNKVTYGIEGLSLLLGGAILVATRVATSNLWQLVTALTATATAARGTAIAVGGGIGATSGVSGALKAIPFIGAGVIATEMIGSAIRGDGKDPRRNATADYFTNFMEFGPLGALKTFWDSAHATPSTNPIVQEQKKTNQILQDLKLSVWGGGPVSARTASDFEAQYAVAKMFAI